MQEPLPKPDRVPALDSLLIPRQDDDDEDLERLAAGLKVIGKLKLQIVQLMLLHYPASYSVPLFPEGEMK